MALAIGDPFGVGQTVTRALCRRSPARRSASPTIGFFIQTDAAINPGNSGGALIDMQGAADRHQRGDFSQSGRLGRHRLRHSGQYGQERRRGGEDRRQGSAPALARRQSAESSAISPKSLGLDRPVRRLGGRGRSAMGRPRRAASSAATSSWPWTAARCVDSGGVGYRLGARPLGRRRLALGAPRRQAVVVPMQLMAAPEKPPREQIKITGDSPFAGASVVNISPATIEELCHRHVQ